MKRIFLIILLTFFHFLGCTFVTGQYDKSNYISNDKLIEQIPPLKLYVIRNPSDAVFTEYFHFQTYTRTNYELNQEMFADCKIIIEDDLNKNIFHKPLDGDLDYYGYVGIKLSHKNQKLNTFWMYPSIATLTVINIFGFPILSEADEVEIELTIFNSKNDVIAKYASIGIGEIYSSYGWGPSPLGAMTQNLDYPLAKAAFSKAIANALENIKKQVLNDAASIAKKLESSGTLQNNQKILAFDHIAKYYLSLSLNEKNIFSGKFLNYLKNGRYQGFQDENEYLLLLQLYVRQKDFEASEKLISRYPRSKFNDKIKNL